MELLICREQSNNSTGGKIKTKNVEQLLPKPPENAHCRKDMQEEDTVRKMQKSLPEKCIRKRSALGQRRRHINKHGIAGLIDYFPCRLERDS